MITIATRGDGRPLRRRHVRTLCREVVRWDVSVPQLRHRCSVLTLSPCSEPNLDKQKNVGKDRPVPQDREGLAKSRCNCVSMYFVSDTSKHTGSGVHLLMIRSCQAAY